MKKTNIILILMTLLCLMTVSAITWYQYLPSPTVNNIIKVFANNDGKAFAITAGGANCLLYNNINWSEINCPDDLYNLSGYVYFESGKTDDGKAFISYYSGTPNYTLKIYRYTFFSGAYSYEGELQSNVIWRNFVCQNKDNTCFASDSNGLVGNPKLYKVYPSFTNISTGTTAYGLLASNTEIYSNPTVGGTNYLYEWNGVSWVLRITFGAGASGYPVFEHNSNEKLTQYLSGGLYRLAFYNYTAGMFISYGSSPDYFQGGKIIFFDGKYVSVSSAAATNISDYDFDFTTGTPYGLNRQSIGHVINYLDTNSGMNRAWAVGAGGYIYYANSSGTSLSDSYYITSRVSPNPVAQGTLTNICFTINDYLDGFIMPHSNVEMNIYNSTDLIIPAYGPANWNGIQAGFEYCTQIDNVAWNNFNIDNYTIVFDAIDDAARTATLSTVWQVLSTTNTTQTVYNSTESNLSTNNGTIYLTSIYAITNYSNKVFGVGKNNLNEQVLFDMDVSDVNNPITSYLSVADSNKSFFFNTLSSIGTSNQYIFAGSNDGLYIYNKSNSESVKGSVFVNSYGNLYSVNDVSNIDDNFSWVCRNGLLTNNAKLFNLSSGTYDATISGSPCKSIITVGELIIVHDGNLVEIFNRTSYGFLHSITTADFLNLNALATQDLLSYKDGKLYVITGAYNIKQYNLSLDGTVTYNNKCYLNSPIQSIEAVNANEVLLGTSSEIQVCNFANPEAYDPVGLNYYGAHVFTIGSTNAVTDLITVNDKYVGIVKYGNRDELWYFTYAASSQIVINNAMPTINDLVISDTTPCIGQEIFVTIDATDNEGDDITYDWNCINDMGWQTNHYRVNDFSCIYSTVGTKYVTVYATDNTSKPSVKRIEAVTVSNCTANYSFYITFLNGITGNPVEDVIVTLNGVTSYTDNMGNVGFEVPSNIDYDFSYEKTGYYSETRTDYPHNFYVYIEPLESDTGGGRTVLNVITKADNGSLLASSLVSILDPVTGQSYSGITGSNGKYVFLDILPSTKYLVSATNDVLGYLYVHDYTSISNGQTKTVTLTMSKTITTAEQGKVNPARKCRDAIAYTLLCGNLSTSGSGSSCTTDADCITDSCNGGTCSTFNWTICEYFGETRGNGCFIHALANGAYNESGKGGATGIVMNFFLNSFLWVLLIIIIIVFVLLLRKKD